MRRHQGLDPPQVELEMGALVHHARDQGEHARNVGVWQVSDDELDVFAGQLEVILGAVARVGEVAADEIPPTSHAVPLQNVFRADERRPSLTQEQALSGAPAAEGGRFRVPRILDDEPPMGSSLTEPDVIGGDGA